ncbi:hypothetical protein B0H19DRAFT_1243076 [Mycena capillaripes]|nr:hypothetical protein B0H19DRAFT_1243076 [Mycena capillaripes]
MSKQPSTTRFVDSLSSFLPPLSVTRASLSTGGRLRAPPPVPALRVAALQSVNPVLDEAITSDGLLERVCDRLKCDIVRADVSISSLLPLYLEGRDLLRGDDPARDLEALHPRFFLRSAVRRHKDRGDFAPNSGAKSTNKGELNVVIRDFASFASPIKPRSTAYLNVVLHSTTRFAPSLADVGLHQNAWRLRVDAPKRSRMTSVWKLLAATLLHRVRSSATTTSSSRTSWPNATSPPRYAGSYHRPYGGADGVQRQECGAVVPLPCRCHRGLKSTSILNIQKFQTATIYPSRCASTAFHALNSPWTRLNVPLRDVAVNMHHARPWDLRTGYNFATRRVWAMVNRCAGTRQVGGSRVGLGRGQLQARITELHSGARRIQLTSTKWGRASNY